MSDSILTNYTWTWMLLLLDFQLFCQCSLCSRPACSHNVTQSEIKCQFAHFFYCSFFQCYLFSIKSSTKTQLFYSILEPINGHLPRLKTLHCCDLSVWFCSGNSRCWTVLGQSWGKILQGLSCGLWSYPVVYLVSLEPHLRKCTRTDQMV